MCVLYLTLCNPMDCGTPGSSIHRSGNNMELLKLSVIPSSCPMNTQSNFLEKGLLCKFSFKISPSSPPLPARPPGSTWGRRGDGHSHRKRTYQMVSFFSWGPNRGFS